MSTLLVIYQLLMLSVLLALLGIVVTNLLVLPRLVDFSPGDGASLQEDISGDMHDIRVPRPLVAVLVPARDEEANIEACLLSLFGQDYPNMQVWLYDDASTDGTARIAARLAELAEGWLRVITGTGDPPAGWLGKANACHQLYGVMRAHIQPDYVLFTDADVRFAPSAVSHAVAAAHARGAGLLSIFPQQVTVTWAERLAVPILLHWAVYTFLPLPLAFSPRTGPAFAAANGQFMLFTREAYEACGGHTSVKSEVLEDVALGRAAKRAGHRALLADGGPLIRTRMYGSAAEVWQGYSKNAYAFFGYSPFFLGIGIITLTILYILPLPFALYSALSTQHSALAYIALAQYGAAVLGRLLLAARFGYRIWDVLLHPVAIVFLIAIALNSMRWSLTGKAAWKGRATLARKKP
ncbi:MAG TPA: glycosyltransferase [Chloroflexia bacterium]|nr:glycosyltransferase [Chloroflexia bacterium]